VSGITENAPQKDLPSFDCETRSITRVEFDQFRDLIYRHAGISMSPQKRQLVEGRLKKRLRHHELKTYSDYLQLLEQPHNASERQVMVDLLTTNETYFYREPSHFELLKKRILPAYRSQHLRVWSAASSSGEEAYTLAMILADVLGMGQWEVMGSDISEMMLKKARDGLYPLDRARGLPVELLSKYCLKGVRSQAGFLLIEPSLRRYVTFRKINLMQSLPLEHQYDLVFLRNVLIYFDAPTTQQVVRRIIGAIKPGGYLFTSHVESLHGVTDELQIIEPSVFRKPLAGA